MQLWPVCIFLGALLIRLATLGLEPLWYDESFTAAMTRLSLPDMIGAIRGDVHPPLWYLIERGFVSLLGPSEFVFRLPAALASAVAALQSYHLLRGLSGDTSGRVAGVLMAVLPGQINYGQEARMYSLMTLLVLVGVRLALARKWLALGAVMASLNWSHNLALIYSGLFAVWALAAGRRRALSGLLLAGGLSLPWLAPALHQAAQVGDGFWLAGPGNLGGLLYYISFGAVVGSLPDWAALSGIIASAAVTLISVYLCAGRWRKLWPLALFGFGPSALLGLITVLWRPVLLDRSLIPASAAVIGLWSAGLPNLSGVVKRAVLAVAAPTAMLAVIGYFLLPCRVNCDPLYIIERRWETGDAIYHMSLTSVMVADYYLPDLPAYLLPEAGNLSQSLSEETKAFMGLAARQIPVSVLAASGVGRLWVIYEDTPMTSDIEAREYRALIARYPIVGQWVYTETQLATTTLTLLKIGPGARSPFVRPRLCAGGRLCGFSR
jgi:hypothetical protein